MQSTKIQTDDSMMELISHGSSAFPFQYYYEDVEKFDNRCIDWHWHREFELVFVTEGIVQCSIGNLNYILETGDSIFINSRVIHRFRSTGTAIIPNILFAPEFIATENNLLYEKYLLPFLSSGISHFIFRQTSPWQKEVLSNLLKIYEVCEKQQNIWELEVHQLVCKIWMELYEHRNEFSTMENMGINRISQSRFLHMTYFIEQNYEKKLSLEDIAASAGVSKREALRCFKCSIPISPIEYLNKYRLQKAYQLILHTNRSITDIAESTGFESTSYFDRLFKREFHITPREHRSSSLSVLETDQRNPDRLIAANKKNKKK